MNLEKIEKMTVLEILEMTVIAKDRQTVRVMDLAEELRVEMHELDSSIDDAKAMICFLKDRKKTVKK